MPRKRPSALRPPIERSRPPLHYLPDRVAQVLDQLDDHRLHAIWVDSALHEWRHVTRWPWQDLTRHYEDWTDYIAPAARQVIEDAMDALPHRSARELAAIVAPWDELYRSKTAHNPFADPARGLWMQRWRD